MAAAAQIVEGMGADVVDMNMGCPVPKIAKHNAGCSLMREPAHAASVVRAMARAVRIPVTVKMRAGWDAGDDQARNWRGEWKTPARRRLRSTAGPRRSPTRAVRLGSDCSRRRGRQIPVFGSGDCVGRRSWSIALRAAAVAACWSDAGRCAIRGSSSRRAALAAGRRRARHRRRSAASSCSSTSICCCRARGRGRRLPACRARSAAGAGRAQPARGREKWVINKLRALNSWYTKGLDNGSHLRVSINAAESIPQLRDIIEAFFASPAVGSAR